MDFIDLRLEEIRSQLHELAAARRSRSLTDDEQRSYRRLAELEARLLSGRAAR